MIQKKDLKPNYSIFGGKGNVWSNTAHIYNQVMATCAELRRWVRIMQGMLESMQAVRSAVQSTKSKIIENKVAFRRLSSYIKVQTKKEKKVMTNTNIQNTISKVSNNMSSLFSKEDVIKLLTDLDTEIRNEDPKPKMDIDALLTTFRQVLSEKDWDSVVDKDDIHLSMSYDNRIEVEDVPINEDFLIDEAVDALEAVYNALDEEAN